MPTTQQTAGHHLSEAHATHSATSCQHLSKPVGGERCLGVEGDVGAGVEDNGVVRRLLAGDNEEEDDEEPGRGAGSSHRKCSSSRFCKSLFPLQIRQIY